MEETFALRELIRSLGSPNLDCRQTGAGLDPSLGRASYLFNPTIPGIEAADAILIVGANPRTEASMLNVRIRKRWRMAPLAVGVIGEQIDLTYPSHYLGAGSESLAALARGEHSFLDILKEAKAPLVIVGSTVEPGVLAAAAKLRMRSALWPRAVRASASCTMRPRGSARWISASCRGRAA